MSLHQQRDTNDTHVVDEAWLRRYDRNISAKIVTMVVMNICAYSGFAVLIAHVLGFSIWAVFLCVYACGFVAISLAEMFCMSLMSRLRETPIEATRFAHHGEECRSLAKANHVHVAQIVYVEEWRIVAGVTSHWFYTHPQSIIVSHGVFSRLHQPLITAIFAHELAHIQLDHVFVSRVVALMTCPTTAFQWLAHLVIRNHRLRTGLFTIIHPLSGYALSVAFEHQADLHGARMLGSSKDICELLLMCMDEEDEKVKTNQDWWFHTHPSLPERIRMLHKACRKPASLS